MKTTKKRDREQVVVIPEDALKSAVGGDSGVPIVTRPEAGGSASNGSGG